MFPTLDRNFVTKPFPWIAQTSQFKLSWFNVYPCFLLLSFVKIRHSINIPIPKTRAQCALFPWHVKVLPIVLDVIPLCLKTKIFSGNECLRVHIELNSNSSGQVLMIILLYYIYPISCICTSLLSGCNQCRDPINNGKDCRVGQLARSWWLINDEYSNSDADTVCLCLCSFLWVLRGWWTKADIIDTVNKN